MGKLDGKIAVVTGGNRSPQRSGRDSRRRRAVPRSDDSSFVNGVEFFVDGGMA